MVGDCGGCQTRRKVKDFISNNLGPKFVPIILSLLSSLFSLLSSLLLSPGNKRTLTNFFTCTTSEREEINRDVSRDSRDSR